MDRARLHAALDVFLDALDEYRRAPAEEELVRVRDLDIEAKARAELVRSGRLRTVTLGRERWTRRSWLLAAVDALPPARREPEADDLTDAATKRASRKTAA